MSSPASGSKVSRVVDDGSVFAGEQRNLWQDAARRFRKNWLAVAGLLVVGLFLSLALIGPHVAPYDFLDQNIMKAFQGSSAEHVLGTDDLGRDVFSRMLHGARTAALVAFFTTIISLVIGVFVGAWSGIHGGRTDQFLMWISDLIQAMPGLLLVILINTTLRRPIVNWFDILYEQTRNPFYLNTLWLDYVLVFSALALIGWPGLARLIRGQVLSIKEEAYVLAARPGRVGIAYHAASHHSQRLRPADCRRHGRDGRGCAAGSQLELPRHRHSASERQLGFDAGRGPAILADLPAFNAHPGNNHRFGASRLCVPGGRFE